MNSAVPEFRKKPRRSTGVRKPDLIGSPDFRVGKSRSLAPVQTAAGLGMTTKGRWPRSGGAAGFPPQNAQNRRVLGTPGFGMRAKGAWPATDGIRRATKGNWPATGGIRRRAGSWAGRSCARVICNVIGKVNSGQYGDDVSNGTPVEKGRYQTKAGTRKFWTRLMKENVPFVSDKVFVAQSGKLGS